MELLCLSFTEINHTLFYPHSPHFSLSVFQETREGDPVFDREGFCIRHTCGHCTFHPGEERPKQTDDRGVSGKPTETVQQGCVGVSNDVFPVFQPQTVSKHPYAVHTSLEAKKKQKPDTG